MDVLTRFFGGGDEYTFTPAHQISLRDNFRDVVPRVSRLPGLSGGFDEFGSSAAPGEVGNVQFNFWIFGDSKAQITEQLDALGQMTGWGVKRLYKQPTDSAETERYCEARVNSIDYSFDAKELNHKRIRVQINFQVANPVWLGQGTEAPLWGGGVLWGGSSVWGGGATVHDLVGFSNDISINVSGNTPTPARIKFWCETGQTASDIRIQRIVGISAVDEVRYNDTLTAGDELVINARALSVKLNSVDAYGSAFTFDDARWMLLQPGTNTIRVLMDNATDAAKMQILYYELWR